MRTIEYCLLTAAAFALALIVGHQAIHIIGTAFAQTATLIENGPAR